MVLSHSSAPLRNSISRHSRQPSFGLPSYASAVQEKMHLEAAKGSWLIPLSLPGSQTRRIRLRMISPGRVPHLRLSRLGRRRGFLCRCLALLASLFAIWAVVMIFGMEEPHWTPPFRDSTLVFGRENLQRIWKWEIESGHYPSSGKIPEQIGLSSIILNPALPPAKAHTFVSPFTPPPGPVTTVTRGNGPHRRYLDIENQTAGLAYPPRPISGSVADLDIILEQCNFSQNKYVRDCLEFLRVGAGLDNGRRVRRGKMDEWKYVFTEEESRPEELSPPPQSDGVPPRAYPTGRFNFDAGLSKKRGVDWEPLLPLPPPSHHSISSSLSTPCDPENPRIFHMFWGNRPFDDKPYVALLSFLYTQNLGLHLENSREAKVCRPQFWLWINPGHAASVPNPSALDDMYQSLKTNPWAAPFLHPRFKDVVKFKLWNTTEQLDGIPELKDEWRKMGHQFTSGGYTVSAPPEKELGKNSSNSDKAEPESEASYDRLSVILSDMARFVLCHRFGGIYLDADTIFLRDWEELWGWNGAFAYRWSYHDDYNTAVLHLNKNSALGSFLFKTAVKNGLDFHPVTVTRYLKEAHLESLLLRAPDALFDPAWLNTEGFQLDRPTQPTFLDFGEFFQTPALSSASPQASGFEGFFRGAFSYHFHNSWWKAFDPSRNWADLGPRFAAGEKAGRALANPNVDPDDWVDRVSDDKRDLDWATVLKRTFESHVRGERPNMYGEWLRW
ncbi:hypothetical protein BV22DRAFT_1126499 [Leucogyrophana mollusca]|uniref:Uncharacterized protein n=1 Tax=Leucogyrophana mollusca TaxID=85980 RepID=A0ACB8BV76_9AGAM|nr:hypothetical protein BV22DRAFT_1126499 [Leucogyrophana mollusca]